MKTLNKFGYSKVEILVIVLLLGVVAFITINKTSYAFMYDGAEAVSEVESLIELQARDYALQNKEIFKDTDTTYISVNDLVENGFLFGNEDGLITSPVDSNKSFNDNKIKLVFDEDKNEVKASLII